MPWTPPASVKTVAIRPLNKGMITEMTSQQLPDGSFVYLENMYGGTVGPKKYPGSTQYAGGDTFNFVPHSYFTSWRSDGAQTNILLCDHGVYAVDPNVGFTEIEWKYIGGTQVVVSGDDGLTVTGTGTAWDMQASDVKRGDVLWVANGTGGVFHGVISTITSWNTLPCPSVTQSTFPLFTSLASVSQAVPVPVTDNPETSTCNPSVYSHLISVKPTLGSTEYTPWSHRSMFVCAPSLRHEVKYE